MSEYLYNNLNPEIPIRKQKLLEEQIKYRTQVGLCVSEGFRKRGYVRSDKSDQNWDIYWVQKEYLDAFYSKNRVLRDQRVNHYRSYFQICRKDNLNRNIKKYKRNLERQGKTKQAAQQLFIKHSLQIQFRPLNIPLTLFKRLSMNQSGGKSSSNIWIMKPTAKSQGKGIFLFNKLSAIQEWMENPQAEAYICQKYIENPLLIGNKKFDLRLYVLCTSYRPLTAYIYREGFARFTHYPYDDSNIQATQVHLTNVAIQKHTSQYSKILGGKWLLSHLKKYLLSKYSHQAVNSCFSQITLLALKTLKSVSRLMSNESNCFELYGFDIMLDSSLKPWLIQVNGSPSMRANTKKDRELKIGVIDDMLSIIDIEKVMIGNQGCVGGFDIMCRKDRIQVGDDAVTYDGFCMLGCKLQRQKCYRVIASTINSNFRSNNSNNTNSSIIKNDNKCSQPKQSSHSVQPVCIQNQGDQVVSPSPNKKGFSVRKHQKPLGSIFGSNLAQNSRGSNRNNAIVSNGNMMKKQSANQTVFGKQTVIPNTYRKNYQQKKQCQEYNSPELQSKSLLLSNCSHKSEKNQGKINGRNNKNLDTFYRDIRQVPTNALYTNNIDQNYGADQSILNSLAMHKNSKNAAMFDSSAINYTNIAFQNGNACVDYPNINTNVGQSVQKQRRERKIIMNANMNNSNNMHKKRLQMEKQRQSAKFQSIASSSQDLKTKFLTRKF